LADITVRLQASTGDRETVQRSRPEWEFAMDSFFLSMIIMGVIGLAGGLALLL
jgi:hypothetical protein